MSATELEQKQVAERITRIRERFAAVRASSGDKPQTTTLSDFENFVKWEPAFDNAPWHNFGNLSGS